MSFADKRSVLFGVLLLQAPNFPAVLYSFHVFRSDYRAAAAAQIAWGARLGALEREHDSPCVSFVIS